MLKKNWFFNDAQVDLFVEGESGEALYALVSNALHSDYYAALTNIKQSISVDERLKNVEFVLSVISGGTLYALVGGGAVLWLVRQGSAIPLLKTLKSTSSVVSGRISETDVFEVETSTSKESFQKQAVKTPTPEIEELPAVGKETTPKGKLVGLIDNLLDRLPERKIIIHGDDYKNTRSKKASLIGIALLGVLAVSIYFGMAQRENKLRIEEYEPRLLTAIHDYEESIELVSLSQSRARELILSSRQQALSLKEEGVVDERLTKLMNDISMHLGEIAGIYDTPAEVFLDLSIISSGFQASDISFSGGVLRVLDSKNKRLAGIDVSNKRTNVIAGPDYLPDALSTAAYADRSFILSSDGIREVTSEVDLTIKPDGWDPKNVLIYAFTGNIYVLDRDNNQIWRYQGVRGGFLEKEPWLGQGFTRDTSDAAFFAIDGSIWTVSRSGEFKVYTLGAPATFSITNETSPLEEIAGFYTDDESDFLYLLDRGNARIAVIEKSGVYVSEYMAPELQNATDLVVDEEHSKILFLADGKLYSIEAKHLEGIGNEDN